MTNFPRGDSAEKATDVSKAEVNTMTARKLNELSFLMKFEKCT